MAELQRHQSNDGVPPASVKKKIDKKPTRRAAGDSSAAEPRRRKIWLKYGQKNVSGKGAPFEGRWNSQCRYYRCYHPGCPARRHIVRALDRVNGVQNDDEPTPEDKVVIVNANHNHKLDCDDTDTFATFVETRPEKPEIPSQALKSGTNVPQYMKGTNNWTMPPLDYQQLLNMPPPAAAATTTTTGSLPPSSSSDEDTSGVVPSLAPPGPSNERQFLLDRNNLNNPFAPMHVNTDDHGGSQQQQQTLSSQLLHRALLLGNQQTAWFLAQAIVASVSQQQHMTELSRQLSQPKSGSPATTIDGSCQPQRQQQQQLQRQAEGPVQAAALSAPLHTHRRGDQHSTSKASAEVRDQSAQLSAS